MKTIKTLLLIAAITLTVAACNKDKYDDTDLRNKIAELAEQKKELEEQKKRIAELEEQVNNNDETGSAPETENLYAIMKDQVFINYCKAMGLDGGNGVLSPKEAAAVTYISIGKDITSMADIEYFTGLTWLECSDNELTELDLSKNTALIWLDCQANNLTSLDLSKNTALTQLNCGWNNLTSLDLSNNTALTFLDCWGNRLTSLDVSENTALTYLYCNSNPLLSKVMVWATFNITNPSATLTGGYDIGGATFEVKP